MSAGKKLFIHSHNLERFPYPAACPFNTSRAGGVKKTLDSMELLAGPDREVVPPEPADRKGLEKFHSPDYLDALERCGRGHFEDDFVHMGLGTGDCPVFEGVYDYGLWVASATITGAKMILSGKAHIAFNPSGGHHHAGPYHASGFCYINDVVLGCMTLADAGKKVLYLDVDVHHGDGVQNAFYNRDDVMTISVHQDGRTLFPGTGFPNEIGAGKGQGFSVNIPLPPGTYDEAYMTAIKEVVLPLITVYDPDCIVIEIGADGLSGDPLANLNLTNNVYADIITELLTFNKPILATGGGGYNVENTVRAWSLVWTALCGDDDSGQHSAGMGGVMLESTDWSGGLRDRVLAVDKVQQENVDPFIAVVINTVKENVFAFHGL